MEVLHENPDLQAMDFKAAFGADSSPAVKNELIPNPNSGGGVGGFQEEDGGAIKTESREIWLGHGDVSNGVDPSSLFYADDDFPPLPEFPCMSSSSSTPTTPAPSTVPTAGFSTSGATSSSSSPSSSWAMLKSDAEADDDYHHHHHQNNNNNNNQQRQQKQSYDDDDRMNGVECMNVMEDFDCMGINQLIEDSNEIWDPTPLFEDQSQIPQTQTQTHLISPFDQPFQHHHHDDRPFLFLDPDTRESDPPESASALSEDLAVVFFEWLKSNKESISAEELRSIKIKKSTIESAAKRLGGGKEGMKQLLKLILQWVQNHRLHTKRSRAESDFTQPSPEPLPLPPQLLPDPELPNPNPNYPNLIIQHEPQLCFNPQQQQQPWMSPYIMDPGGVAIAPAPSSFTSMVSYIGGGHDPYATTVHQPYHAPTPPPDQYHHMIDGSSWAGPPPPQFPSGPMHYNTGPDGSLMAPQGYPGYGYNPYQFFPGPGGDGLVRMGSSATKEARKKRMARQRRVFTHHHHRGQHHGSGGQQQQMIQDPNARVMIGDHDGAAHGGWVYWPPTPGACGGGPMTMLQQPHQQHQQPAVSERTGVAASTQGSQRQTTTDKKQGFKTEKNLKFLLQKVLKQSDVGNLGRIVLPKKEAETHLPELEARDGIPIAMEDIGTSRVWNMRYRFWPNNKSRMYLLENTGDFVRSNGLQEGDFIVIYSDVKCGKYMIRGVKVRPQQQGSKAELAKKPSTKALKTQNSASPAGSTALSPLTHSHRQ